MSAKILWQLQLSCYDANGKFVLTADSNWQIFATNVSQIAKLDSTVMIDVILPDVDQCLEDPRMLLNDLGVGEQVSFIRIPIIPNAPATRFDFPYSLLLKLLSPLSSYTHVYINDPLLLPHYKALFHLNKGKPKFILQTHFLDSPMARVVDPELSYWYGTVEACDKSDLFFWHCNSMQNVFKQALQMEFLPAVVDRLMKKSDVWKAGYSIDEIRKPIRPTKLRFDPQELEGKTVVWVPNRVGGLGKSFDYTNNGKFLFEIVPEIWKRRQDFVVIAGNPNQKISNDELAAACPAYKKLVAGIVNRDEYRWLSQRADIVVGLYTNDTNGGLASLESIEFNALPLFPDIFEYKVYFDAVNWPQECRVAPEMTNIVSVFSRIIDCAKNQSLVSKQRELRTFIRQYAAYENTTGVWLNKLLSL